MSKSAMNWWRGSKGKVKLGEPLSRHTTFKIGGPAEFFINPQDVDDLKLLIAGAKKENVPVLLLGAGSNILASDNGVKAAVLQLNSPCFKRITINGDCLEAGCGLGLWQLVEAARMHSLSGVEFMVGIPGTVGGALVMNAGAWGKNIAGVIEKVRVMDYQGKVKILNKSQIEFGYRTSDLGKYIILSAYLKLNKMDKKEISDNIKKYLRHRFDAQDNSLPNAGCIFKNPPGESAGRLIDMCGLKGKKIGGAVISRRHANFILNQGRATSRDVLGLADLIVERVSEKFKLALEPEIKIWE